MWLIFVSVMLIYIISNLYLYNISHHITDLFYVPSPIPSCLVYLQFLIYHIIMEANCLLCEIVCGVQLAWLWGIITSLLELTHQNEVYFNVGLIGMNHNDQKSTHILIKSPWVLLWLIHKASHSQWIHSRTGLYMTSCTVLVVSNPGRHGSDHWGELSCHGWWI